MEQFAWLERIRKAIHDGPCTVGVLRDKLAAQAILAHQRQLAGNETFAHIAYLQESGLIERGIRPDGIYDGSVPVKPLSDVAGVVGR